VRLAGVELLFVSGRIKNLKRIPFVLIAASALHPTILFTLGNISECEVTTGAQFVKENKKRKKREGKKSAKKKN
jgi:hypothetical protein